MKNYKLYSEDDFIMDPDFQAWVKEPSPESELFWNKFQEENPEKKWPIDRAKALLRSMTFKKNLLPSEKEAMWQQVRLAMQKQNEGKLVFMKKSRAVFNKKIVHTVVALFAACVLSITFYYFTTSKPRHLVATKYGEIRKITLPDSSSIILNANSNIKYDRLWNEVNKREVWIDGEAFLSVKHTKTNQSFIVHTNEADIEVLGTEFNVMKRDYKVRVSLNSGRIRLKVHNGDKIMAMVPGDILEVNNKTVQKSSGKVENLSLWKENKMVFDDTPLSEILVQLKYIYGWEFANVQQDILDETLTGEVETKSEQELINTLEKALHIEISKEGNAIYISRL
jgi:ferric-dicitrate binding protein FerR (iron transport regulator)